jgi:hypothetical protein
MDLLDLSYEELEATFRHKRKKALPKLWSYTKKLEDPYRPRYYTKIELFVPQPSFYSPFPCILVSIRNAKFKTFFRVLELKDLESIFVVPPEESQRADQALQKAKIEADNIEKLFRDRIEQKKLAGVPTGIRGSLKVDQETGELVLD